jgi:hypothetical protein
MKRGLSKETEVRSQKSEANPSQCGEGAQRLWAVLRARPVRECPWVCDPLNRSSRERFCGLLAPALLALLMAACGYHVGGHADLMPATIRVIAIPPIANNTVRPKLPVLLAADITREFQSRTKYTMVTDPTQADAVLKASIAKFVNFPTIADPASGRATGAGCLVTMNLLLTDRRTGKVLFSQVGVEFRERYEISIDPKTYFDESDTALERLSRDVAHSVVTAILEKF